MTVQSSHSLKNAILFLIAKKLHGVHFQIVLWVCSETPIIISNFCFSEELVQEEVAEPIDEDGKGIICTSKCDKQLA